MEKKYTKVKCKFRNRLRFLFTTTTRYSFLLLNLVEERPAHYFKFMAILKLIELTFETMVYGCMDVCLPVAPL